MEPRKNPEYLQKLIDQVGEFRELYEQWLNFHVITDSSSGVPGVGAGLPAVMPLQGVDETALQSTAGVVARAAGRIAEVASMTGATIAVQGLGPIDPFVNALYVSRPKPPLEPRDVLQACDFAVGRLEGLRDAALVDAQPLGKPDGLHPLIWGAAGGLWRDGYRRRAVSGAAEALVARTKAHTGRTNLSDTGLWQELFSDKAPLPGQPRLRWPGDPTDLTVKSINGGLRQFAPGVQMLIRNPATHLDEEPAEQVALEQLSALSYLARTIDGCALVEADAPPAAGTQVGPAQP